MTDINQTDAKESTQEDFGFNNLSELSDDQIVEIEDFSDLPEDLNELIITDPKGNPIFKFDTRDQIKEFLSTRKEESEERKKKQIKDRYDAIIQAKKDKTGHF